MEKSKEERRKTWISWILWGIAIVLISRAMSGHQKVAVTIQNDGLTLQADSGYTEELKWEDIASIELQESFSYGTVVDGTDSSKEKSGIWTNDTLGQYTLVANAKVTSCVVCHTESGRILVFNFESEDSTRSLYNAIQEKLLEG